MNEEICASCHGSGTTTAMTQGLGPDDYEVDVSCPKCGGTGTLPATPKPRAGEQVPRCPCCGEIADGGLLEAERDLLREREKALVEALDLACHWAKHNGFGEGAMAEAPWLDKARTALAKSDDFNCQVETKPCQRWCGANPCLKPA